MAFNDGSLEKMFDEQFDMEEFVRVLEGLENQGVVSTSHNNETEK